MPSNGHNKEFDLKEFIFSLRRKNPDLTEEEATEILKDYVKERLLVGDLEPARAIAICAVRATLKRRSN